MPTSMYQRLIKASAIASLLTASIFSNAPAKAATFVESLGNFSFGNFSQAPLSTDSSAFTSTLTNGDGADAVATSDALFSILPNPESFNAISNFATSNGSKSTASAESEASIIGNFFVNAGDLFSFDFLGNLALSTFTDQPTDFAAAALQTQYSIFTQPTVIAAPIELDFFNLFAQVSTPSGADSFNILNSESIALDPLSVIDQTGPIATAESLSIGVSGRYERLFSQPTAFSLVEFKQGSAFGKSKDIPEPSTTVVWLLGVAGMIALGKQRAIAANTHHS